MGIEIDQILIKNGKNKNLSKKLLIKLNGLVLWQEHNDMSLISLIFPTPKWRLTHVDIRESKIEQKTRQPSLGENQN